MGRFLAGLMLGLLALASPAQAWPDRPGTVIAPFGPATSVDIVARLLAPRLQAAWGQSEVVTNVPGAAGITGVAYNEPASQIQDVLTRRVTMTFQSGVVALPRPRDNAWRAIAVSSPNRMQAVPNFPTIAELGYPGFDAVAWLGVDIVGSTPDEFRALIEREIPRMAGVLSRAGIRPE